MEKEERRHKEVRKEETEGTAFSLPNGKDYHKENTQHVSKSLWNIGDYIVSLQTL